jgi:hypothetical protein
MVLQAGVLTQNMCVCYPRTIKIKRWFLRISIEIKEGESRALDLLAHSFISIEIRKNQRYSSLMFPSLKTKETVDYVTSL